MKGKDLNFNSQEEEECVETIFSQAMECLKEEDRSLNFIETLLPLLKRGIGVHHSGLLPILKEVIELLFQEQLIKVNLQLFCSCRWSISCCSFCRCSCCSFCRWSCSVCKQHSMLLLSSLPVQMKFLRCYYRSSLF